jgi:hypothetical protein
LTRIKLKIRRFETLKKQTFFSTKFYKGILGLTLQEAPSPRPDIPYRNATVLTDRIIANCIGASVPIWQ